MVKNLRSRMLPGLGAVVLLLSGILMSLVGAGPVKAQAVQPAQWQLTAVQPGGIAGHNVYTCIDATQADTLQVELSKNDSVTDIYALNWKTGDRKPLNSVQFDLCTETGGLLGINQTQNVKPSATSLRHIYPGTYAHDGNQLFYDLEPVNQDGSGGSYLYVSKDGLNWDKRPHHFAGNLNSYNHLAVPDNDSHTVYVLDCVQGATSCLLNLSHDSGQNWQVTNNAVQPGIAAKLKVLSGHNTPYKYLNLTQLGTQSNMNISTNEGGFFYFVGAFPSGGPGSGSNEEGLYEAFPDTLRFRSSATYPHSQTYIYTLDYSTNEGQDWKPGSLPDGLESHVMNLTQFPYAPSSFLLSAGKPTAPRGSARMPGSPGKSYRRCPPAPGQPHPINIALLRLSFLTARPGSLNLKMGNSTRLRFRKLTTL